MFPSILSRREIPRDFSGRINRDNYGGLLSLARDRMYIYMFYMFAAYFRRTTRYL